MLCNRLYTEKHPWKKVTGVFDVPTDASLETMFSYLVRMLSSDSIRDNSALKDWFAHIAQNCDSNEATLVANIADIVCRNTPKYCCLRDLVELLTTKPQMLAFILFRHKHTRIVYSNYDCSCSLQTQS